MVMKTGAWPAGCLSISSSRQSRLRDSTVLRFQGASHACRFPGAVAGTSPLVERAGLGTSQVRFREWTDVASSYRRPGADRQCYMSRSSRVGFDDGGRWQGTKALCFRHHRQPDPKPRSANAERARPDSQGPRFPGGRSPTSPRKLTCNSTMCERGRRILLRDCRTIANVDGRTGIARSPARQAGNLWVSLRSGGVCGLNPGDMREPRLEAVGRKAFNGRLPLEFPSAGGTGDLVDRC